MAGSTTLTGDDTLKIKGRILADLTDGDYATVSFPNDIADIKTGKDGNSVYSLNETGRQAELSIRILRGSSDDKFLQNLLAAQRNDFSGFVLLDGEFIKRAGDGEGNITNDIYMLKGGIFSKNVEAKSNSEGDTEQSVSVYSLKFANCQRVLS